MFKISCSCLYAISMLTLYLHFAKTAPEKTDRDAEGLIKYAFLEPSITPIMSHPLYHYFVGDIPGLQVIIYDNNFHGVMVASHGFKISIVRIPRFKMDCASGKKCTFGL